MKIKEEKKFNIITDSLQVKGGADYTFVCRKIPFAVTCSTDLAPGAYNFIDLDLVNKMRIPLLNIKVTRMCLHGQDVRVVGAVSQTVQCVSQGKIQGTINLEAKVVRNLYDVFNVDCLASIKTFTRLTGCAPPEPRDDADPEPSPDVDVLGGHEEEEEALDQGEAVPDEPDPPDTVLCAAVGDNKHEDEYTKHGYKDFEDALENAPWSHACIPREPDTWRDDIAAADKGYPDTRYDYVSLAMLRQGLANLGPSDQDQDNDGGNRFHAQFGVKTHAPHLYDAPQARHGPRKLQLRGPRGRRMATKVEEEDEYTADELAAMHGYPPVRAGRIRRT